MLEHLSYSRSDEGAHRARKNKRWKFQFLPCTVRWLIMNSATNFAYRVQPAKGLTQNERNYF